MMKQQRGSRRLPIILLSIVALVAAAIGLLLKPRPYVPYEATPEDEAIARAYLEEYPLDLPETWRSSTLNLSDLDVSVRWSTADAGGENGTVLFIPGFGGTTEAYGFFYQDWIAQGFRAAALDLPGQGGSSRSAPDPEKPWSGDFSLYGDVLAAAIAEIAPQVPRPLIVMGESFGGGSLFRAAADHDLAADGVIFLVPALETTSGDLDPENAKRIFNTLTRIGFGHRYIIIGGGPWTFDWEALGPQCATRPDRVRRIRALYALYPELRVGSATNEWLAGLERSGRDLAEAEGLSVSVPSLAVIAENDQIVINDRTRKICGGSLANCTLIELEGSGHCVAYEPDETIDQVNQAIFRFAASLRAKENPAGRSAAGSE